MCNVINVIITLHDFRYMFLMLCMNINSIPIKCTVLFFNVINTRNVQQNLNMPLSSSVEHIIQLMLLMSKQVYNTIISDQTFMKMPTRMTGHLGTCARMCVDACMRTYFLFI